MIIAITNFVCVVAEVAIALIAAILILRFGERTRYQRLFAIYPALSAIQVVLMFVLLAPSGIRQEAREVHLKSIIRANMLLFILTEIVAIACFIYPTLSHKMKKLVLTITCTYLMVWTVRAAVLFPFRNSVTTELLIQNMFGILLTSIILSTFLFEPSIKPVFERKEFWLISSNFYYFCVTSPVTALSDFFLEKNIDFVFDIVNTFNYSIVFICWTVGLIERKSS